MQSNIAPCYLCWYFRCLFCWSGLCILEAICHNWLQSVSYTPLYQGGRGGERVEVVLGSLLTSIGVYKNSSCFSALILHWQGIQDFALMELSWFWTTIFPNPPISFQLCCYSHARNLHWFKVMKHNDTIGNVIVVLLFSRCNLISRLFCYCIIKFQYKITATSFGSKKSIHLNVSLCCFSGQSFVVE